MIFLKNKSLDRRTFIKQSALAALGSSSFSALSTQFNLAHAQVGGADDYRALVCVFLYGGNDAFNMLVPRSAGDYNVYADARRNLATAREDLLALNPANSLPADYGLHPELTELKTLFDAGKLTLIGNVGTLSRHFSPTSSTIALNFHLSCSRTTTNKIL